MNLAYSELALSAEMVPDEVRFSGHVASIALLEPGRAQPLGGRKLWFQIDGEEITVGDHKLTITLKTPDDEQGPLVNDLTVSTDPGCFPWVV